MTDHPCKGLPLHARRAFEVLTINQQPNCKQKTLDLLLESGLIERGPDKVFRDSFGEMRIAQYFVPLPVHYQFCNWASEQPEPDSLEDAIGLALEAEAAKKGKK